MVETENLEMVVEGSGSRALDKKKKKKRKKKTSVSMSTRDSERMEKRRRLKKEQTSEDEEDKKENVEKHSPDQKEEENGGSGGDLWDEGKEAQSAAKEDNKEKGGSGEVLEECGEEGKKAQFAAEKADNEEKQQKKHSADEKEEEIGGSGGDFEKSGKEKEKAAEVEEPKGTTKSEPEVDFLQKPPLAGTSAAESLKPWQRKWSEKDEVTILKAIIKYMKANDAKISDVDMKNMVESIIGSYQFQFVPETKQLRDKIWKLKRKYSKNLQRADRSKMVRHQRRVFKLSKKIWADLKINQEVVRGCRSTTRLRQIELCQKELERRVEETQLKLERLIGSSGSC